MSLKKDLLYNMTGITDFEKAIQEIIELYELSK